METLYNILKTLVESMSDNDLLMYQDAGAHIIKNIGPLLKLSQYLELGIVVFHTSLLESTYSKRDSYIYSWAWTIKEFMNRTRSLLRF